MRTKRSLLALASLGLAFTMVAASCGGDDGGATDTTAAPSETTAPSGGGPKVGLLYDITGRGDKSFNDAAAAGLDKAKAELGVVGTESTPTGDADRPERLNQLVADGNELIIGVGFLWGDAITAGAQANPNVNFAIVDSVVDLPNVASLVFKEQEGSYLVGVAAALKTKTNNIGFIGGVENDLIKRFEAGFIAGAKSVKPDIKIQSRYISQPPDFSGFNDPAKGKEIALSMYEAGADIIYSAAGGSGVGAFQAAKEKSAGGTKVWGIGVDSDQYNIVGDDLKEFVLTSMLKKVDVAVFETIKALAEGNFKAGVTVFDAKSGGVDYATSGGFVDDIKDQLEKAREDIVSGKVVVPDKP